MQRWRWLGCLVAVSAHLGCGGGGPEVAMRFEGLHAKHAIDQLTPDHRADSRAAADTLIVRGDVPGRAACSEVRDEVVRRDSIVLFSAKVHSRTGGCVEFHVPSGMRYEARVTRLPRGTYTVIVHQGTEQDSTPVVHRSWVVIR